MLFLSRTTLRLLILTAALPSCLVSAAKQEQQPQQSDDHATALIDWLRAKGGYVSDKIAIQRHPQHGHMGVFAVADIPENETILEIPKRCYLGLTPAEMKDTDLYHRKDVSMDQIMQVYFANACQLAQKLLKEQEKWKQNPEESEYGPYLAYLETIPQGMLPATYSEPAKQLLRQIQGRITKQTIQRKSTQKSFGLHRYEKETATSANYGNYSLPPWQLVDWIDQQFVQTQCIDGASLEQRHAVALAIQRGYDSEFIPIWDMFNHHNGKLNVDNSPLRSSEEDGPLKAWASDDIKAGDELYGTYNYCRDCYNVGDDWGTPGMFRDFGFVEDFPQVWPFLDHEIYYEVVEDKEEHIHAVFSKDETTGEFVGVPNDKGLQYLQDELSRIAGLEDVYEEHNDILPHELEMIQTYHRNVMMALTAGIEATLDIRHPERLTGDEL